MRKLLLVVPVVLVCLSGCSLPWEKRHCGLDVHFIMPASIETNGTVLIQGNSGSIEAHPMGTVTGPISDGSFNAAPTKPAVPPAPMPNKALSVGDCGPQAGPPRLSCDEWMNMMNATRNASVPVIRQ